MKIAFLIRHADRTTGPADPGLNALGQQRAQELVRVLRNAGISRIYVSDTRRSRETAAPLAAALNLTPEARDPDAAVLSQAIHQQPDPARVLVIGHTNTIPELFAALTGDPPPLLSDAEFDHLFVCAVTAPGQGTGSHLRYGASTPAPHP